MRAPKLLLAKTSLDGHWRGPLVVSQALRDAGFEVVFVGMATVEEIVRAAVDEDVDLVGLSVGGRVEVAERIVEALRAAGVDVPCMAGGTLAPEACRRLREQGVLTFPPGSSLEAIVETARSLTEDRVRSRGATGDAPGPSSRTAPGAARAAAARDSAPGVERHEEGELGRARSRDGGGDMNREEKKKLVLDTWQAIAVGDVKAAFANLSDEIRWKIPGSLEPISGVKKGKGEILEFLRAVSKIFPPAMRSEIRSVHVDGDTVIVEMVNRSKTASGRPYENEYCFVFEMSEGKIREIREYVDTQRAYEIING